MGEHVHKYWKRNYFFLKRWCLKCKQKLKLLMEQGTSGNEEKENEGMNTCRRISPEEKPDIFPYIYRIFLKYTGWAMWTGLSVPTPWPCAALFGNLDPSHFSHVETILWGCVELEKTETQNATASTMYGNIMPQRLPDLNQTYKNICLWDLMIKVINLIDENNQNSNLYHRTN